jgi:DNA-directed RNA polymerase subunit RPC12/RpoP
MAMRCVCALCGKEYLPGFSPNESLIVCPACRAARGRPAKVRQNCFIVAAVIIILVTLVLWFMQW